MLASVLLLGWLSAPRLQYAPKSSSEISQDAARREEVLPSVDVKVGALRVVDGHRPHPSLLAPPGLPPVLCLDLCLEVASRVALYRSIILGRSLFVFVSPSAPRAPPPPA